MTTMIFLRYFVLDVMSRLYGWRFCTFFIVDIMVERVK